MWQYLPIWRDIAFIATFTDMEVFTLYIWKQINIVRKESSSIHMSLNVQKWEIVYTSTTIKLQKLYQQQKTRLHGRWQRIYELNWLLTKLSSPIIRDNLAVGSTWIQDLMKFWSGCMLHWLDWALCWTKANPQRPDWNEIHWSPITCSLTSSNATAPMFQ